MSGRWASWLMRSLPRMNLTSSLIGASLLPQLGVDHRLTAHRRACVENVPDRLLVESDQGDHDFLVAGEPADDPDGDVRVERVGGPPQLVSACLPDVFEGRSLLGWLGREVVEFFQERGRDREEAPALLLGVSEPAAQLVGPVDDYMPSQVYGLGFAAGLKLWWPPRRASGCRLAARRRLSQSTELIILHLLLATSALVSATSPRGRMLILDESGNNLDAPNLRQVSQALQQIADKVDLTMVPACQDLHTSLVSERSTGIIQLVRVSTQDVLNAPVILQEGDPVLAWSLEQYLLLGRPGAHASSA